MLPGTLHKPHTVEKEYPPGCPDYPRMILMCFEGQTVLCSQVANNVSKFSL